MIATLKFLKAELNSSIGSVCMHLRNKAYAQKSQEQYNAMSSLVYYQIIVDELSRILHAYSLLLKAMESFLQGEEYDLYGTDEEPPSIYDFCLHYFIQSDCPLGQATPELTQWVATHADRQQALKQGLRNFFPELQMGIVEEAETGEMEFRVANEEEQFKSETESFLRDIETSNALEEFNQLMQQVRTLLQAQAPIAGILDMAKLADKA